MAVLKTLLAVSVAAAGAQACAGKNYRPAGNMMRRQDQLSATVAPVGGIVAATAPPSSVPLNSIFASMLTVSVPLPATPTAGQQPAITNAPTLPQCASDAHFARARGVQARGGACMRVRACGAAAARAQAPRLLFRAAGLSSRSQP
jgi:hypothetical protein